MTTKKEPNNFNKLSQSINKLNNKYIVNAILTIMLWLTILTQVLASIWSSGLSVYSSQQIFKSPFSQYRLVVNVTWFVLNCRIIKIFILHHLDQPVQYLIGKTTTLE